MAAIGPAAGWLTENQPWHHGFGPGSPLARLTEAGGQVLLLGAPLDRLTILHHAESLVDSPEKRMARHAVPVRDGSQVVWREVRDHDRSTAVGAFPYERAVGDQDPFAVIGQLALDAGCGVSGRGRERGQPPVPGRAAGAIRRRVAQQPVRLARAGGRPGQAVRRRLAGPDRQAAPAPAATTSRRRAS
jgi:Aminoglycoside 3-N-acetyltransferase